MEINTIIPVIILIVGVYAFITISNLLTNKKYLDSLKSITYERYGKEPTDIELKEEVANKLYILNQTGIDDITFKDLELFRLFKKINHTDCIMGAQALYEMLRNQNYNHDFHNKIKNIMEELTSKEDLTKELKFEFGQVGFFKKSLVELLSEGINYDSVTKEKLLVRIFRFGIIFIILSFMKSISFGIFVMLAVLIINFLLDKKINKQTSGILYDMKNLGSIFKLSIKLETYGIDSLTEEIKRIKELNKKLSKLRVKSKSINIVYGTSDSEGLSKIFDLLFLIPANKFFSVADLVNEQKNDILELYRLIGKINAYTAITSYKKSINAKFVEFSDEEFVLKAEKLSHPLLGESQVSQDFDFTNKDILLTGSNASGKSTFLRNVGIATAFANSFGLVHAESYKTSFFMVQSAIDISDSLEEKMSYFMAETKAIKRMIKQENIKKLLILDEIFKGTNTIDRIAAAYNTLRYIGKNSLVIAATHDIELTDLLKEYTNYHFEESIKKNDIKFDYKLKVGKAESRNAIEILRVMGYPSEIIDGAYKLAKELEEKKII